MNRIAFFVSSMGRGGAERVVSILSRHYCELGWNVDICMLLHDINEYPLDARVNVIDMSFGELTTPIRQVKTLWSIRTYVQKQKPAIIIPFLAKISILVELALIGKSRNNFRVVTSERIDPYSVNYSKLLRWLVNKSFESADAIVFQTRKAKSYYPTAIQAKSYIIGNPVAVYVERANEPGQIIVNAGRMTPQKNQLMLIDAFAGVYRTHPEYKLYIYGDGPLKNELVSKIEEHGLNDCVFLPGSVPDYLERLSNAEVFVLSSDYEGLSNALLEAMTIGIPVVSTECAGSDEVICDGENGLLVPVGDAEALTKAMIRLIEDKDLASKLGEAAKEAVRRFSVENVINEWECAIEG